MTSYRLVKIRLSAGNGKVHQLKVGYNCEDEVLLQWPAVGGATQYQIYQLGEKYLEPFQVVSDTLLLVNNAENKNPYFAVVPLKGATQIGRSFTLNYLLQGTGCYIRSFLPRELVSANVYS
jgi:hypothetical protein